MKTSHIVLLGCGVSAALCVIAVIVVIVWLGSQPEGGVRLANEMDAYALDYLDEHGILNDTEELLAYYDVTIKMDGTEAAVVTNERLVYLKHGRTTAIALVDIEDIRHHAETLMGDVFEVTSVTGQAMKIEIAPFNGGETFGRILQQARARAREGP